MKTLIKLLKIKNILNILLILIGFIFIIYFIWIRFIRERLPKEIPFENFSGFKFLILSLICFSSLYILIKRLKKNKRSLMSEMLSSIYDLLLSPLYALDKFCKKPEISHDFTKKVIYKIINSNFLPNNYYLFFYILPELFYFMK